MRHLLLSRELAPAPYGGGGIGTYVANIATLLAERGETVHVIGQQWRGASQAREERCGGRLVLHRVPADAPVTGATPAEIELLARSAFPSQAWAWNATHLAESLVRDEGIDVIEAQEWEAPLYFLLLRRALGLGPERRPPCIVHLHSPSEFIWRHNDWPSGDPRLILARRFEEYTIGAADALLCPSSYLANQAAERYGLARQAITVIPLPIGSFAAPPRDVRGSGTGPVLYVGRIERRKGLVEFVDAAVAVAGDDQAVTFAFVGSDVITPAGESTRASLRQRIPPMLAHRFQFKDSVSRDALGELLATAALAVVPSRWENFPYVVVEAMHAGVPVLVSPNGGMVEVVTDGVSGWVCESQTVAGLEAGLRRALATPVHERARMGQQATAAVREHCGDDRVVTAQLEFRAAVARRGATRSLRLPANLPWAGAPMHDEVPPPPSRQSASAPATTATANPAQPRAGDGLRTLVRADTPVASAARYADAAELPLIASPHDGAMAECVRTLAQERPHTLIASLAPGYAVEPGGLRLAVAAMSSLPDVGLAVGWVRREPRSLTPPCPAFPFQWLHDETWPVVVYRAAAVIDAGAGAEALREPFASWDLANAVLARGWRAISVPAILAGAVSRRSPPAPRIDARAAPVAMRQRLLARFPELLARDAVVLVAILDQREWATMPWGAGAASGSDAGAGTATYAERAPDRWTGISVPEILRLPMREKFALLKASLRDPARVIAWARSRTVAKRG